jgi:hypothetical protein
MKNAQAIGMKNFIEKKGEPVKIYTKYKLDQAASAGAQDLVLVETFGIFPGCQFILGAEPIEILSILGNTVALTSPIENSYDAGVYIESSVDQKCLPAPTYQRITQDYLEYTRRIRLPADTLINYGSLVLYEDKRFYVVGIDSDRISKGVKLREINVQLTVYRETPGVFNGFSYESKLTPIYENVEGHYEYLTSSMLMTEAGYNPSTISYITIPDEYDVRLGDIVTIGTVKYKVTGLDPYKFKNLNNLVVDYENTK